MIAPSVSVIILNWNGWKDTIECLRSLRSLTYPEYHIILIDNGSTDNSVKELLPHLDTNIHFFPYKENLGFAKASNLGMQYAIEEMGAEFVMLLNNDTVVSPNTLDLMVHAMRDPEVGMVQPLMLRMDNPDTIDSTGHNINWGFVGDRGSGQPNKGQYTDANDLIGVSGAAGLYRVRMLIDIGLLDESFGTCFEDAELSWRAYNRGWKTAYEPGAVVLHKRSVSLRRMIEHDPKWEPYMWLYTALPCKMHGNVIQKAEFVLYFGMLGIKSEIGMRIGRNNVGGGKYIKMIQVMFS